MIFRALFSIAVVALLMPHEPNLGLGRPGASDLPGSIAALARDVAGAPQQACTDHAQGCMAALGFLDMLQNTAVQSLAQVKAEIEQSQRERQQRLAYND